MTEESLHPPNTTTQSLLSHTPQEDDPQAERHVAAEEAVTFLLTCGAGLLPRWRQFIQRLQPTSQSPGAANNQLPHTLPRCLHSCVKKSSQVPTWMKDKPHAAEVSTDHRSLDDTRELADTNNSFPTSTQLISDTAPKDMLVSLRSSLHKDMMTCMQSLKMKVQELGGSNSWSQRWANMLLPTICWLAHRTIKVTMFCG